MTRLNTEIVVANDLVKKAQVLMVTTNAEAEYATEVLSRANKALDILTTKEEERTQRLKEELEFIKAPYIEPKKQLKEIIKHLRSQLGSYQTKSIQQAVIEAEEGIKNFEDIKMPAVKMATPAGTLTFRPKQTLKIVDLKKIPKKYLVPDLTLLFEALRAGTKVPGCEIEIIQVPFNRRA